MKLVTEILGGPQAETVKEKQGQFGFIPGTVPNVPIRGISVC